MTIYGFHPVLEALRAGRVTTVLVGRRQDARIEEVIGNAKARGITVRRVEDDALDREAEGKPHQGVVAKLSPPPDATIQELVSGAQGVPLLVVLDGVEDPQNLGALLRTCDGAGVDGVIRQTRRAAALSGAVAKASAGAVAHVRTASVVNIARTLEELKELGVWTVGLAADAKQTYDQIDWKLPSAVVLGAEGYGLRRLVGERCDWLVSIPMVGHVSSLNVSVAAGVVLYEAVRQRRIGSGTLP